MKVGKRESGRRAARLRLETLEGRETPAGITFAAGVVEIEGSVGNDTATVTLLKGGPNGDTLHVSLTPEDGAAQVLVLSAASVTSVEFLGDDGNDTFQNNSGHQSTAYGGDGNDRLIGGWSSDEFHGGNGYDNLRGNGGNDILYGDAHNDVLHGGDGWDSLHGGTGSDHLYGGAGNDVLWGDENNDYLYGGSGNDDLFGGDGNDQLKGEDGLDDLFGGDGDDTLDGGDDGDEDYMEGEAGADTFYGEPVPHPDGSFSNFDIFGDFNPAEGDTGGILGPGGITT